jgi:L-ascorbate metabolism protein UlaG (beta-lactamase superfamily)
LSTPPSRSMIIAVCLIAGGLGLSFPEDARPSPGRRPGQAPPARGEAVVRFLGHCGFAVETANHFLVFDYVEKMFEESSGGPTSRSLETGFIDPTEIKGRKVRVFITHEHGDHFDPVIFEWEKTVPDIRYFFGWKASDEARYRYLVGPRAEWSGEELEVFTVNSHHSGVPEVAYLVKVDGLAVYFNGDYQGKFEEDFPFLKGKTGRIDLAFVPPVWEEKWAYSRMNTELIRLFQPAALFPMHVRVGDEELYFPSFEKAFQPRLENGRVILTRNKKGAAYAYADGVVKALGAKSAAEADVPREGSRGKADREP